MPKKAMQVWGPKSGRAAEWSFAPSAAIRKSYPEAPAGEFGMDLQDGEVMRLEATKVATEGRSRVVTTKEGVLTLLEYSRDWQELASVPDDVIEWDVARVVEAWSSDD